jgi:hypothetical protein
MLLDTVSGARKREIADPVLRFAQGTASMPEQLSTALDAGLVRPGRFALVQCQPPLGRHKPPNRRITRCARRC